MQPLKEMIAWLNTHTSPENYLFSLRDIQALFPESSLESIKTLLSRSAQRGYLDKICRNLYGFNIAKNSKGLLLFHAASYLRANEFNYLSLETILSEAGVISQIPINFITLMSSGRSNKISCGKFGTIEFVHTSKKPETLTNELIYDPQYRLWRANVKLAIKDLNRVHRNCDLIDWEVANEFI